MKWRVSLPGQLRDDLVVGMYSGDINSIPTSQHTPIYALQFLVKGTLVVEVNHKRVELQAPCAHFIYADHTAHLISGNPDGKIYGFSFSPSFGNELRVDVPRAVFAKLYAHPVWAISEERMQTVIRYLELLRDVVPTGERTIVTHLLRSLYYYLALDFIEETTPRTQLTRSEAITGRFLALVEQECCNHHNIEWYASELCLTTKYVANVVKQVTGRPAGQCIDEAIIRHARSFLLSTPLSIQEVSNRLGFQNQSHFGTFFRREMGVSPKQYRMQQ